MSRRRRAVEGDRDGDARARRAARDMAHAMQALGESGLNEGAAGNLSVRLPDGFLITPGGVKGSRLSAELMVRVRDGEDPERIPGEGGQRPSSEWRMHAAVYAANARTGAVVHTHSPYATALACLRRDIPAFHYTVALAGAAMIPCAPYATFGSEALSRLVVEALSASRACLLANHGVVACGRDLDAAMALAAHVEYLARVYLIATAAGDPALLDDAEMTRVMDKIEAYGAAAG